MSLSLARSYAWCTRLARRRAGSFYYSFLILPRRQRQAMCALYAFLRVADDLADEPAPLEWKAAQLDQWHWGLEEALAGGNRHPVHPALRDAVERYHIPPRYLYLLLDGVRQDLVQNRYASFAELYRYCYLVASVVGLACIRIWGCADERAEPFAEASGIAFQLTNILRDVTEDARQGRVYLPHEDLVRFGCSEEQLLSGPCDEHYRALMEHEAKRAREYYTLAQPLAGYLPPAGRAIFQIMTRTYREILAILERRQFDPGRGRARVSGWRKLGLLLEAMPVRWGRPAAGS